MCVCASHVGMYYQTCVFTYARVWVCGYVGVVVDGTKISNKQPTGHDGNMVDGVAHDGWGTTHILTAGDSGSS